MFVRDYALGDMAEGRFAGSRRQKCIGPQFYVRGDGTRAFYFSEISLHCKGQLCCSFRDTSVCRPAKQTAKLKVSWMTDPELCMICWLSTHSMTLCHDFCWQEGLSALFNASAFTCEYVLTHERVVENQALGTKMDRRWIQAVFRLTGKFPGSDTWSCHPTQTTHTTLPNISTGVEKL